MHPFGDPNPEIEFEERLDDEEGGYVFKVNINSQPFALKVFKFFDALEERMEFNPEIDDDVPDEIFEKHIDPFYAECRAYGRINEFYNDAIPEMYEEALRQFFPKEPQGGEKRAVAAQCYGYLYLSPEDEEYLSKNHGWTREEKHEGKPLRALVKQLIDPIDEGDQANTLQVHDNLRALHSIGIFPQKVSLRNYRDGLLMSFSSSYTVPHCIIQALPEVQATADFDMQRIDNMIDGQGIETSMAAVY
ncbi:hypothetical protein DIS24_g11256 [Lasiodiplodia hormozganensis]|uniref:Uncharacterized protein n=1 Tax=Lasiodiplodia hormozganensis TaxID=869390 RepID=A0AA40C2T9_9PEZI|nr:hypothetical protein DIS24_g11256 [Lasiodiplodia hormozganensis]